MTSVVRKSYKLNKKSVFPSVMERQSVQFVCNIFHESTIAGLEVYSKNINNNCDGTVEFLRLIKKWWNIVNCKSTIEGIIRRDPDKLPIYSLEDESIIFLKEFLNWINRWMQIDFFDGGLTKSTFNAMHQTVNVLIEIAEKALIRYRTTYIMFGKFQTDNLESRFSWYRRLSGCNFHVSYQDVILSEKKN